jgi:Zn finger protein HypA/HybF involved in hydrogenase expression
MALELLQSNKRILIKQISTMSTNKPSAHIALNNNRLKAYADVIYLKDGDEFQIELFNPCQVSVLAKIYINDNLISTSGMLIRPGQRYFLERYIDDNKKFKFNTYTVDSGTTPEVLESIKKNGSVRVDFYREYVPTPIFDYKTVWQTGTTSTNIFKSNDIDYSYYNSINYDSVKSSGTLTSSIYNSVNSSNTSGINTKIIGNGFHVDNVEKSVETGRIEGGSKSSQTFSKIKSDFEQIACATSEWKILPDSHRPIEVKEIRNYCSNCGTRMKKQSWKFCPNCGEKL